VNATTAPEAERLARELCKTARYYVEHRDGASPDTMWSSALLCLTDAESLLEQGAFAAAYGRARRSLLYTVGDETRQFCRESDDTAMTRPERESRNTSGFAGHEWRHPCTGEMDEEREPGE
jgi:hypothetical protein